MLPWITTQWELLSIPGLSQVPISFFCKQLDKLVGWIHVHGGRTGIYMYIYKPRTLESLDTVVLPLKHNHTELHILCVCNDVNHFKEEVGWSGIQTHVVCVCVCVWWSTPVASCHLVNPQMEREDYESQHKTPNFGHYKHTNPREGIVCPWLHAHTHTHTHTHTHHWHYRENNHSQCHTHAHVYCTHTPNYI